jgi:AP2 domain/HNH endonuclease
MPGRSQTFPPTGQNSLQNGTIGDGGNRTRGPFPPNIGLGIPVTAHRGFVRAFAVVDAEDYPRLAAHRWHFGNARWRLVKREEPVSGGYVRRYLHREVLGLAPDDQRRVDHINGDTLDNRRANLRIVTDAENAQNQGSRGGSSRYRGVTFDKSRGRWMATAMLNGRRTTIGRYATEIEAAEAAAEWRARNMPFSAEGTRKSKGLGT